MEHCQRHAYRVYMEFFLIFFNYNKQEWMWHKADSIINMNKIKKEEKFCCKSALCSQNVTFQNINLFHSKEHWSSHSLWTRLKILFLFSGWRVWSLRDQQGKQCLHDTQSARVHWIKCPCRLEVVGEWACLPQDGHLLQHHFRCHICSCDPSMRAYAACHIIASLCFD